MASSNIENFGSEFRSVGLAFGGFPGRSIVYLLVLLCQLSFHTFSVGKHPIECRCTWHTFEGEVGISPALQSAK
ncbi:hypothetical protein ASE69_19490 [Sphingomonas sp. Leaf208]|nr:hypothetical protein ASE69_19490 [Sphingomonas sp. Leaf208]